MALVQIGDESITVSTTAIGFTAAELTVAVIMAFVTVESGGPIRINAKTTPTAGGAEGSPRVDIKSLVEVVGDPDLRNFRMIVATGGVDATVRAQFFGDGRTT